MAGSGRAVADVAISGQQDQRLDVAGTEGGEVTAVEGGELGLVEALDDGEDGSVDEANVGVGVVSTDLENALIVLNREVHHVIRAGKYVVQEGTKYARSQPGSDQLLHLDKNRRWN